jgi:hypothetical protein
MSQSCKSSLWFRASRSAVRNFVWIGCFPYSYQLLAGKPLDRPPSCADSAGYQLCGEGEMRRTVHVPYTCNYIPIANATLKIAEV